MTEETPDVLREELDLMPLYPTWISHILTWAQNRVSAQLNSL